MLYLIGQTRQRILIRLGALVAVPVVIFLQVRALRILAEILGVTSLSQLGTNCALAYRECNECTC